MEDAAATRSIEVIVHCRKPDIGYNTHYVVPFPSSHGRRFHCKVYDSIAECMRSGRTGNEVKTVNDYGGFPVVTACTMGKESHVITVSQ
ncbi:hypothetical protein SUGI_0834520 [Cryptomeria japonica]|nr:hypothetical protein SUGI_0834520 [Cryptomeria japonica]